MAQKNRCRNQTIPPNCRKTPRRWQKSVFYALRGCRGGLQKAWWRRWLQWVSWSSGFHLLLQKMVRLNLREGVSRCSPLSSREVARQCLGTLILRCGVARARPLPSGLTVCNAKRAGKQALAVDKDGSAEIYSARRNGGQAQGSHINGLKNDVLFMRTWHSKSSG